MAAQKGSALLLKATLSGTESTVAGLRSTSMTINGEMVDITTKDSDALVSGGVTKARELLDWKPTMVIENWIEKYKKELGL